MKKHTYYIAALAAAVLASCAEDNVADFQIEKPDSVVEEEEMSSYGPLLDYIAPSFKLGSTLDPKEFRKEGTTTTIVKKNFNELTLSGFFTHSIRVNSEGKIDSTSADIIMAASLAKENNISLYGESLLSAEMNSSYLKNMLPGKRQEMKIPVSTYDGKSVGDTYPVECNGNAVENCTAEIVDGFDTKTSKCLHVKCGGMAMPVITLNLGDHTIGECTRVDIEFCAVTNGALTGDFNALHVRVNNGSKKGEQAVAADYPVPSAQGCELGKWGKLSLDLSILKGKLTDIQKALKSIDLEIGTVAWSSECYFGDFTFYYEDNAADYDGDETKALIDNEMKHYVQTIVKYNSDITAWTLAENPVSSSSEMIWKRVLGDDYFVQAAKYVREEKAGVKLFVSEVGLLNSDIRTALVEQLKSASDIDGIDVNVSLGEDTDLSAVFTDLAATGKLIRLNIQSFEKAEYLAKALTAYKSVPEAQRYGVSFAKIDGIWNVSSNFNRTKVYQTIVDALK